MDNTLVTLKGVIPANQSYVDIQFNPSIVLPNVHTWTRIIRTVDVYFDTSGVLNYTASESVPRTGESNAEFRRGYQTVNSIEEVMNEGSVHIDIFTEGNDAFFAQCIQDFDLTNAPEIANIMGFPAAPITAGTFGTNKVNITQGLDIMMLYSPSLIPSNTGSETFLAAIPVENIGTLNTFRGENLGMSIGPTDSLPSISFKITKLDGSPYPLTEPVNVFINIVCFLKNPK